ncbi:MAG: zinc-ribbon domain-containing protein [Treponema sp.]|nr:zinc-ribbon domain-containing protein [Treponema sp.]
MKCIACGAELAAGAKFCSNCGAKVNLEPVCPNCGKKLEVGAKFCSECGTKIGGQIEGDITTIQVAGQTVSIFVNIADEGLFGTAGYWKDGAVQEFPFKSYPETYFSIDAVLKDAKAEAEKTFGKVVDSVVVGIPDIIKYSDLARYKTAIKNAGFSSYLFLRTTVAQALAIGQDHYRNHPDEDLDFGIYNYVDGKLIGTAVEACDGVVEVKYVEYEDENFLTNLNGETDISYTFCKKNSDGKPDDSWNTMRIASWDDTEEDKIKACDFTKTICFNENCSELQNILMHLDGADKNYLLIGKGKITNTGLALQAALLSNDINDLLLLDTLPFSIKLVFSDMDYYSRMVVGNLDPVLPGEIHKNTTIPTRISLSEMNICEGVDKNGFVSLKSIPLSTNQNNQTSIKFGIRFGTAYAGMGDEGENLEIANIPPAPATVPKIELAVDVNVRLDITVTAKILGTDIEQTLKL